MAVGDATKWFTQQGGDPATGFVSGADGVQSITQVYSDMSVADDALVPKATVGNLLTANQASVETDTTGFSAIAGCTIARSTAQAKVGSASLLVTSTAGASGGGAAGTPRATSGRAVTPGVTYTGIASVLNGVGTRTLQLRLLWWDGAGTFISTADGQTATPATWTTLYAAGVAPANAAYVSVEVNMTTVGSIGDTYYLDCLGFWQGAGGLWALPGTPVTNLGFYTDESVGRRLFQWDANNARWQQTFGDTGWRDVSADLVSGTTGTWHIRRVDNVVYHRIWNVTNSTGNLYEAPTGFRFFGGGNAGAVAIAGNGGVMGSLVFNGISTGGVYIEPSSMKGHGAMYFNPLHNTEDAWPTSLPGTAVGSIPA